MQEKKTSKNLRIRKVCIVGVIPSFAFQRAKHCALELHRKLPQRFPLPEIVGLLELDWSEKLQEWRQMLGREYWCLRRPVAVFFDNRFIGSDIELIKLTTISNILLENIPRKDMSCLKQNFRKDYISYLKNTKRVYCYLDICIDEVYAGTLTFRLYSDLLPRTCENFKSLCLGNRSPLLSYKGSRIHRIVKKGWLQGGDIQYKTGGGGFSIFCDPLEDESFGISHDKRGVLSMASAGRHKNGSQFFITLQPSKWMDTHFVAFGQLIEGVKVLKKLEDLETFYECPLNKVEIKNCGKLDLGDVEDVDAVYKEERLPVKKRKKIETISAQIMRSIIEALTEALKQKVHPPDILDDGDIPSKMNLQLYFQGFYSLPRSILEKSAAYLRNLRRELFRLMKPSATEVVESLMYDLQMAVLTRMTNLDDMRETIGRDLYNKMIAGIDMTMDECKKGYVKRFIDQVVTTAEDMVNLVTKKLLLLKDRSKNMKKFQERMDRWVRSFILQETYEGDNYFIAERPVVLAEQAKKVYEGRECCERERKKKEKELKAKLMAKYAPDDFCCLGSQMHLSENEIELMDIFNTCRYDLKKAGQKGDRMPLLDLIEISRFKLRWIRTGQKRPEDLICTEKKIRRWMEEVIYTPETSWLKDAVFPRDCRVLDHVEEIMYGAMTAGLLEMYYFMDEYIRVCGGKKKQKLVTRTIYPEDSDLYDTASRRSSRSRSRSRSHSQSRSTRSRSRDRKSGYSSREEDWGEDRDGTEGRGWMSEEDGARGKDGADWEKKGGEYGDGKKKEDVPPGYELVPCPCGHPCCDCEFDPNQRLREIGGADGDKGKDGDEAGGKGKDDGKGKGKDKGKGKGKGGRRRRRRGKHGEEYGEDGEGGEWDEEGEGEGEGGEGEGSDADKSKRDRRGSSEDRPKPCKSDETLVDLNAVLAQKLSKAPEEVDINSFKWLKPYILEKGCDLKSKFAARVHEWIDGERFNTQGFISKHSLVTRASLLSLSFSLADLIKEENNLKSEIKDFVYDIWSLYFQEMFKEAILEFPPKPKEEEGEQMGEEESEELEEEGKGKGKGKRKGKRKGKGKGKSKAKGKGKGKGRKSRSEDVCSGDEDVCDDDEDVSEDGSKRGSKSERKRKKKKDDKDYDEKCRKLRELFKDVDFETYCKKLKEEGGEIDLDDFELGYDPKNPPKSPRTTIQDQTSISMGSSQRSPDRSGSAHPSVHYQDSRPSAVHSIRTAPSEGARSGGLPSILHSRPSEQGDAGSAKGSVETDPGGARPSVQAEGARPSVQIEDARPIVQGEPGAVRKSGQSERGAVRKSGQSESGAVRKSGQGEPGTVRLSVQIDRGSIHPSAHGDGQGSEQDGIISEEGEWREFPDKERYDSEPDYEQIVRKRMKRGTLGEPLKRRKSPIVIQELVDEPSAEEVRNMPPYVAPFWVRFLTETTKQALGAFAKVSRLPQRLYLKSDSQVAFEEKMKDWFEFNAFNPQPTKGREVMDYIALHHVPLTDLEDTARSFMKKKKFAGLINRCTRFSSADIVSGEIVSDAIRMLQESSGLVIEEETVELFVSDMISSAAVSRGRSEYSYEYGGEDGGAMITDEREPNITEVETEEN